MTAANRHEWWNRARKVALCVAAVPLGATHAENECFSRELASWSVERRTEWARFADPYGDPMPPSDTTWDLVVEAVRDRALPIQTMGDAHARGMSVLRVLQGGRA